MASMRCYASSTRQAKRNREWYTSRSRAANIWSGFTRARTWRSASNGATSLWLTEPTPVILAVYDHTQGVVYYLDVQAYFAALPDFDLFAAGQTITVHIPRTSVLDVPALRRIADRLREVVRRVREAQQHG